MTWRERLVRFRSFWIFPCLAAGLLLTTQRIDPDARFRDLSWLFPLGLLAWSLIEYGLHRFFFHRHIHNVKLRQLVGGAHIEHHKVPRDPDRLLVCAPYALIVSALVYALLMVLIRDWFQATGIMTGVWAGFLYYESTHYRVHLTIGNSGLIAMQRRAHFYHHFGNPGRCFGVTTPLWDYVFGTRRGRD